MTLVAITDLFEGDLRRGVVPLRKKFQANFNNKMGQYLKKGLIFASFFHRGEDRYLLLSSTYVRGSVTVCKKGPNNGSFTRDTNDLFEEMNLIDQNSYQLVPEYDGVDSALFRMSHFPADAGFKSVDLLLTISAPEQNGRHNHLTLQAVSRMSNPDEGYEAYRVLCDLETNRTERQFAHKFKLQENRYIQDVTRDHIFSCYDGFRNKIPPVIIANYSNLQYLSRPENSSKGSDSWKSLDELLDDFQDATGIRWSELRNMIEDYRSNL